ncbi:hypothetical protein K402DRAFT_306327, partial [Aulographum hederae CBS 113979]
ISEHKSGRRFVVRVPACGWHPKWTDLDDDSWSVQVSSMRYIKRKTGLPMPDVLEYSSFLNNPLGAPFQIQSFVPGQLAVEAWHQKDGPIDCETMRQNILRSVAKNVCRLNVLEYEGMGALHFHCGEPDLGRAITLPYGGTMERDADFFEHLQEYVQMIYPSSNNWLVNGLLRMYNIILDAMPHASQDDDTEKFALSPPDFDLQNIVVDGEGNVTGFLDWDRVETLPDFMAWSCYPIFLTEDWRPTYQYPYASFESSPEQLDMYRRQYADYLAEACGGEAQCRFTRKSHLYTTVQLAVLG